MKLIIAILRDVDNEPVSHALTTASYRVTMIASTGGFLRRGSTTLLVGVDDEQMEDALAIIRHNLTEVSEPGQKRATVFVVKVDQFVQI